MDYKTKYEQLRKFILDLYPHLSYYCKEKVEGFIPELQEQKDERIRETFIEYVKSWQQGCCKWNSDKDFCNDAIAWLERQGEQNLTLPKWKYKKDHTPLMKDSIILNKYGCVAKSPSGALVSNVWVIDYAELAKLPKEEIEKQSEQNPTDKVEPKFKVGDWVVQEEVGIYKVREVCESWYEVVDDKDNYYSIGFDKEYMCHLWSIQDAKDGDILTWDDSGCITLFNCIHADGKSFDSHGFVGHCTGIFHAERTSYHDVIGAHPATKEQRDTLFEKMKEAGYEWSSEKKELRKIEGELKNHEQYTMSEIADSVIDFKQKPEQSNEGNFDMAGLYYAKAILEKTLGKVEGYQSDDGILEHKSAINAVTKLCDETSVTVDD